MQLEPEYDSCRRLSSVSGNIRVQCRQLEVGPVVDESAIFGAKGYVFRHGEVGPAAIDEGTFRLPESPRNRLARTARRIKDQRAAPRQDVRINSVASRQGYNQIGCRLMNVGLNVEWPAGSKVLLRVSVVSVVRFRCQPAIEVIAIAHEKPAGIRCVLRNSISL